MNAAQPTVAVVGGGVTGLVAARGLAAAGLHPVVLEAGARLGGAIRTRRIAGLAVDVGAESLFTGHPAGTELLADLELEADVVAARSATPMVAIGGRLRPLPGGAVLGAPGRLTAVLRSRVLSPAGVLRAGLDLVLPRSPLGDDPTVGELIGGRFGREVLERLVDPLVGSIHAGTADELSARSTAAPIARAVAGRRSAYLALRRAVRDRPPGGGPLFVTLAQGLEGLIGALASDLPLDTVRCRAEVAGIRPDGRGYRVTVTDGGDLVVDGIVLAVPPAVAARLLRTLEPAAASLAATVPTATVATVVVAYPPGTSVPDTTGVLVPAGEGRAVKAVTVLSTKWDHLGDGPVLVRASTGRSGEPPDPDDDRLATAVVGDLAELLGVPSRPLTTHVERWPDAMPQYVAGHEARVSALDAALAGHPRVHVAGAGFRGVGVPACVRSGTVAADRMAEAIRLGRGVDVAR